MSESRKECYKCLNNKKCSSYVKYDSIYCRNNRKIEMNNIDFGKGKDKQVETKFISILVIENLLRQTKETYETIEKMYKKELREERQKILKEKLIRLDERIKIYKEILK